MRTLGRVGIIHVAWSTDKELNLLVVVGDNVLGHVENQMNTLLLSDATHECEKRN